MRKKYKQLALRNENCFGILAIPDKYVDKVITREILDILCKFENAKSVEEQVVLIPELTEHLKPPASHDMDAIIAMLSYLLITTNVKHPVRKSITRIFTNVYSYTELTKNISLHLAQQLLHQICKFKILPGSLKYDKTEFGNINDVITFINGCFENFPTGIKALSFNITEVFSFLIRCLYSFTDNMDTIKNPVEMQKSYHYIHNVTRGIIAMSQQFVINQTLYITYKHGVYERCLEIINNTNIPYDTRSNCGIIMVILANQTKENGYVDLLKICLEPDIPWSVEEDYITSQMITDIGVVCIFSGILINVKSCDLVEYNSASLYLITSRLTEILSKSSNNPTIILGVNRTMLLVSRCVCHLNIEQFVKLLNILLNYVWMNLDHGIDTIRHIARSIYINLIKICLLHRDQNDSTVLDSLTKKTFSLPIQRCCRYKAISALANEVGTTFLFRYEENLVENLLKYAQIDGTSLQAIACYENLMRCHLSETTEKAWEDTWVKPLLEHLGKDKHSGNTSCYQDLLTTAIKLRPVLLPNVLADSSFDNHIDFCSLLKCALIARQLGTVCTSETSSWRGLLQPVILEESLYHEDDDIRISSLALISDSHKSTEIFSSWELCFIIKHLQYNIGTQFPSVRQQILSFMKKIITRFIESYKIIIRNIEKTKPGNKNLEIAHQQKEYYNEFVKKLRKCVFDNLFHGANFNRRYLCLEIFTLMKQIYEIIEEHWSIEECEALLMCLNDTYENNKALAVSLLNNCPVKLMKLDDMAHTLHLYNKAILLASGIRPSGTITAAYLLEAISLSPVLPDLLHELLCCKKTEYPVRYLLIRTLLANLRAQLLIAQGNLLDVARTAPLYGLLFCLRHLMEKYIPTIKEPFWKVVISEIIRSCLEANKVVAPVVNNSSPEGHLPMDQVPVNNNDNMESGERSVTAQMLLVCAWRTVKEVSLLVSEICLKINFENEHETKFIDEDAIVCIGEHFTQLLTETRHRGAFEHAYIGFSRICNRLWKCKSSKLHYLPVTWLQNIMEVISGERTKENKLCETRRSAGLPFMIEAIVGSEILAGGNKNFTNCILMLLEMGKNSTRLETRTHSMNILRALYKHTRLGESVLPYVGDGFIVSITGFSKPTWSERNSASLLFSSLMTRAFGVQRNRELDKINVKNRMTVRVFNQKFPKLQGFLLEQLASATMSFDTCETEEVLYPILIILARLYPVCLEEDPSCSLSCFIPFVRKCAQGRIFRTRELSAKALASILYENDKIRVIKELVMELETVDNNNLLNGLLLQIYQLLVDTADSDRNLEIINIIEATQWILKVTCPMNAALYMQLLVQLTKKSIDKKANQICSSIINDIDLVLDIKSNRNSLILRSAFFLKLHLIVNVMITPNDLKCARVKEIMFKAITSKNELKNFTLNFLIYLLCNERSSVVIENWDIPPEEIELADCFSEEMTKTFINLINEDLNTLGSILHSCATKNDNLASKSYMVLSYFPSALLKINPAFANNEIIKLIEKNKIFCDNNMSCAAICCLKSLAHKIEIKNNYEFAKILYDFSSPDYAISCRYVVAEIIKENANFLLINGSDENAICVIWQTIMRLLSDCELVVRNKMSRLTQALFKNSLPVMPERARELLLQNCIEKVRSLSEFTCILLLLYWIFEEDEKEDEDLNEGQVFEKGEVNSYAESECLSKLSAKLLITVFFTGKEMAFFNTCANIIMTNHTQKFWNITAEQKEIFTYYCKKIDSELKQSNNFSAVKHNIKNSIDQWTQKNDLMTWKFLNILDSFIELK